MKTIEGNKLIAEFLNIKVPNERGDKIEEEAIKNGNELWYIDELKYHDSWDWLMPVVEKVESLGYWVNRINGDAWIVDNNNIVVINNQMHHGGIEATWLVVIEFIKWYK